MFFSWFTERAYHYEEDAKNKVLEDEILRKESLMRYRNSLVRKETATDWTDAKSLIIFVLIVFGKNFTSNLIVGK